MLHGAEVFALQVFDQLQHAAFGGIALVHDHPYAHDACAGRVVERAGKQEQERGIAATPRNNHVLHVAIGRKPFLTHHKWLQEAMPQNRFRQLREAIRLHALAGLVGIGTHLRDIHFAPVGKGAVTAKLHHRGRWCGLRRGEAWADAWPGGATLLDHSATAIGTRRSASARNADATGERGLLRTTGTRTLIARSIKGEWGIGSVTSVP